MTNPSVYNFAGMNVAMAQSMGGSGLPTTRTLVSREVVEFTAPYDKGATFETVYHTYSDGKMVSIQRYTASDGSVSVSAMELDKDGTFGVLRHQFNSEV